jgi:hypothetical protein
MDWQRARQQFSTPLFDSIREPLDKLTEATVPPGIARLNEIAAGIQNFRGVPIKFVANDDVSATSHYETRIAESGEIATRENWHDFFNATTWLSFPSAKSAISEMHAQLLSMRGKSELRARSTPRDVLTLFDEGGIVVTSCDEALLEHIRRFDWKTLFVKHRADVIAGMRFRLFGHSMLEKALDPYVGVTAKAILLKVDHEFFSSGHAEQMQHIDLRAAAWLMDAANLSSSKNFAPLPWLGVPGWWKDNESPSFYDNARYFRSGRTRGAAVKDGMSP